MEYNPQNILQLWLYNPLENGLYVVDLPTKDCNFP